MLNEKQVSLLRRFIDTFGYPDSSGCVNFYIMAKDMSRRDFPLDYPIYGEGVLGLLEEMCWYRENLVSCHDTRYGEDFDGPHGLDQGVTRPNPAALLSAIVVSDEATDWINEQRS